MRPMGLFLLIGGMLGLLVGGFKGMLLGLAVGYGIGRVMLRVLLPRGLGKIQQQFLDSTFSVMERCARPTGR